MVSYVNFLIYSFDSNRLFSLALHVCIVWKVFRTIPYEDERIIVEQLVCRVRRSFFRSRIGIYFISVIPILATLVFIPIY